MKTCFKCKKELPFGAFYKHKEMKDGYLGKCKECTKADSTKYRDDNVDKVRAYDRARGHRSSKKQANATNAARSVEVGSKCLFCGSTEHIEKHHPNYEDATYVVPLCRTCHRKTHAILNVEDISMYV